MPQLCFLNYRKEDRSATPSESVCRPTLKFLSLINIKLPVFPLSVVACFCFHVPCNFVFVSIHSSTPVMSSCLVFAPVYVQPCLVPATPYLRFCINTAFFMFVSCDFACVCICVYLGPCLPLLMFSNLSVSRSSLRVYLGLLSCMFCFISINAWSPIHTSVIPIPCHTWVIIHTTH